MRNNFGENLKATINLLGMTQSDLAQKTGLTRAAVSQILSGKREPTLSTIIKILNVIPIKFEKLAGIE